jgi:hypothetical protein
MNTLQERAEALLADMKPFCTSAALISITPKHFQFRVHRNAVKNPSALFAEDTEVIYPFDHWAQCQTEIKWSNIPRGRHWIGYVGDIKVTIVIEK